MEVVLITHKARYDDIVENVGIAINVDVALKYIESLEAKYPYVYGNEYGTFYFENFKLIDEAK